MPTAREKAAAKAAAEQESAQEQEQAAPSGRLVKYMGSSDTRVIEKGDQISGSLRDGVPVTATWGWDNYHVLNLTDLGWSDAQIDALLETDNFKEVTDKERFPVGLAQVLWRGAKLSSTVAADEELPEVDTSELTDDELARTPDMDNMTLVNSPPGTGGSGSGATTGTATLGGAGSDSGSSGTGGSTATLGGSTAGA